MRFIYKIFILSTLLIFGIHISNAQTDAQKRAEWIFNISKELKWENENDIPSFTIGVFSSSKEYNAVVKRATELNYKLHGKPLKVIRFRRASSIKPVDILYVTFDNNISIASVHRKIKGHRVVLFTDRIENLDYTTINILPLNVGAKRFRINTRSARKNKLIISEELLKHGGTEEDIKRLYSKSERRLEEKQKKLNETIKEIATQNTELIAKQQEIEKQKADNLKTKEELKVKLEEIRIKNMTLDTMSTEAKKLSSKLIIINRKIAENKRQKVELDKAFSEKQEEMRVADIKLKKTHKEIEESKKQIKKQSRTIGSLEEYIIIFSIFSIIIVLLTFLALRGYFISRRANKKLNEQNIAINKQKEEIIHQAKQLELINAEHEKLSIVAGKTDSAVTIMDAEGNFEWVNAGFTRLYGYTLQLLKNEQDTNIINVSKNPKIKALINKCITDKETVIYEEKNITRSGNEIWVQTTLTPIVDSDNNVTKLISIDADINSLKKAEKEIREQHKMIIEQARVLEKQNKELEKLSLIASETDNAILMTDEKGNFLWVNDAYTKMFGYSLDKLTRDISKNIVGEKTEEYVKRKVETCIKDKKSVDYELKTLTASGNSIWVHTTLTPILSKKGEIQSLIAIDTDITKIKKAEFEIRQKTEELLVQKAELENKNDKIERQNSSIHSSIRYAHTIQKSILPDVNDISRYVNAFVLFKPKDIVSGDFYWFAHLPAKDSYTEKIFIAAIDCTGHGVPGAFMSMVGNRLLNEIVLEHKISSPRKILEELDSRVKIALKQETGDNNDGMDLCLCCIEKQDSKNYKLRFSGAKRPLYYKKKSEDKFIILQSDRRSIGGTSRKQRKIEFTNQEVMLSPNDRIWLSTDGIIDQNNAARKRYGSRKFVKLLEEVSNNPLEEQLLKIEASLKEYQENEEQRDDITVLGIEIADKW